MEIAKLEAELKNLIVSSLLLSDLKPDDILSDMPLFAGGLALDSIDALEIGVEIEKKYGIKIDPDAESTKENFATIMSLARFVSNQMHAKV